jgi:predicted nuclease of predicted toxin-antitoxin system
VNFLIDAQLPRKMAGWFAAIGLNALHTLDLPLGNRTTDADILSICDSEGRAVVTKDADFVDSHLLQQRPAKLLLVSTGNINNRELETIVLATLPDVAKQFETHAFLELCRTGIVLRD